MKQVLQLVALVALASSCATAEQQSEPPWLRVVIPPALAPDDVPSSRHDSIWSPTEDRDSIYVLVEGTSSSATVDVMVEAEISRVSLADEAAGVAPTTERIARRVAWRHVEGVDLAGQPGAYGGRVAMVIHPSALQTDSLDLGSEETVLGLDIQVRFSDGRVRRVHVRLLPAI